MKWENVYLSEKGLWIRLEQWKTLTVCCQSGGSKAYRGGYRQDTTLARKGYSFSLQGKAFSVVSQPKNGVYLKALLKIRPT